MLLLCDHDILLKLAACDLLDDAILALGATRDETRILPQLPYMLRKTNSRARFITRYGEDAVRRLELFIDGVTPIREIPVEVLPIFDGVDGIDDGERALFAVGSVYEGDYRILTGDKRSIRALAESECCHPIAETLANRIVCLEVLMAMMISAYGFDHIKAKVVPARSCDTVLKAAFGSGQQSEVGNVIARLDADITELQSLPVQLLAMPETLEDLLGEPDTV